MAGKVYTIITEPGIQRDGTMFSGKSWIDGQWCRFQRGKVKKMGGFNQLVGTTAGANYAVPNIVRGLFVVPQTPNFNVYLGDYKSLKYFTIDQFGNTLSGGVLTDRTPTPFVISPYNDWNFDSMYSTINNSSILIAHAPPNIYSVDNNVETPIYYGDSNSIAPLTPTGFSASGGVVVLHPFLFWFGNAGSVSWSNPNDPTVEQNSARVTSQKIVAGLATRAGNSSPGGLLWSLDSLIRVTFSPGPSGSDFTFDTVTSESSILSSNCVIEYDGFYFWSGIDRFLSYGGTVQEIPNDKSINFFYDNLNYSQRQKVWATKVTHFGEIWWFFPTGNNTECNHAVVYNVREKTWYDTAINRAAGYFDQIYASPIWSDSIVNDSNQYPIWEHEIGNDKNVNGTLSAIQSYAESADLSWAAIGPDGQWQGADRWVDLYRVEPDMLQTGDMTMTVNGRDYARSSVQSASYTFTQDQEKIDVREQRRLMTLRFESNVVGGYYEMGQCLMVVRFGDARQ